LNNITAQVNSMPDLNLVGRTLGRYEILTPLGAGGMAVVYRARQTDLERIVALKILPPELSLDRSYTARFLQEARSAAALEHPHIVPIYDVGATEGLHYIAMKYIAGQTVRDLAQERGALPVREAARLLEQVAAALDYAHSQGIIHRDIKPSNMMVERNGWLYLTDFGLARGGAAGAGLTQAGTVMGTPEYMSPEQAQGLATIGPATDIYALGVVLYELLTGKMPFEAETPMGMLVARLQRAPTPPRDYRSDLAPAVEDVVMRALARRPESRPGSATELVAELKRAAGIGSSSTLAPDRPPSPAAGLPAVPHYGAPTLDAQRPLATPPPVLRTPPPPPMQQLTLPSTPPPSTPIGSTQTREQRPAPQSRRVLAGVGVVLAAVILTAIFAVAGRQRGEEAVAQAMAEGQAAIAEPGGLDRAVVAYERAIQLDDDNPNAHATLALIHLLRGQYEAGEQAANNAVDAEERSAFGQAMLAEALISRGAYDDALAAADRAVELDDDLPLAYTARAIVRADRAGDTDDADLLAQATADAERAIELVNEDNLLLAALAHNARGFVAWQQYQIEGDPQLAEQSAEQFYLAADLQWHMALFHANLGYVYNEQGAAALRDGDETIARQRLDQARERFEHAQSGDPSYAPSHTGLGWNLYYLQDYAGALGEFDKAIELNPQHPDAYIGKARVLLDQPEPDAAAAITVLQAGVQAVDYEPALFTTLGWAYVTRAFGEEAAAASETYGSAAAAFESAIALNDRSVDALTGLGWVRVGQGEYDGALEVLNQALTINEQADTHFGIGWAHYQQAQYDAAETAFRRATELAPADGGNHYWLGLTLRELGRTDEARTALQTALDLGNPFAQAALDELK
jgi:serine/threonine-protein kinase